MPKIPGADLRQSPTIQSLDRFNADGLTALAAIGLVLCDCVNHAYLILNDAPTIEPDDSTDGLIEALNRLQDAIHGSSDEIAGALAAFLEVAESGVCRVF